MPGIYRNAVHFGFIMILGTLRSGGPIIPILSIIFLAYALILGKYIPGAFRYRGVALGRLLYRMYLTDEGIFGPVCTISSTYVYLFILFGAFLLKSGAGDFIIKLAQALTGRRVGGGVIHRGAVDAPRHGGRGLYHVPVDGDPLY